jgi:glycosidase
MRKVLTEKVLETYIDEITNDTIVGIDWGSGTKCMVIKDHEGNYRALGNSKADFNLSSPRYRKSVIEYVKSALEQKGSTAFVFDSAKELFEWMSK